jgi:branched-chain amino acid aminotransferase
MNLIYLNGEFVPAEQAKVSVFDHGFLYGDGVFEGIRAYNGRVFRLEDHVRRLFDSAQAIMLCIPMSQEEMCEAILETLRKNNLRDAYIRPIVSRGHGDLGLDPNKCPMATVIIIAVEWGAMYGDLYEIGLTAVSVAVRRNSPDSLPPNRGQYQRWQ